MEHVYAILLLNEVGRELDERNVTAVLEAAGVTVDEPRIRALVAALGGVDVESNAVVAALDSHPPDAVADVEAPSSAEGGE